MPQRKTVQGPKIKNLSRLISLLSLGQWIMIIDIGNNNVFEVLSDRTGERYLTSNPPDIRLVVE